ncbi:MAG: hypothetical protein D8B49_06290 [Riemerella sp.]|jgi:hypothetical protein|uniref:AAA domain protein n=1 Tax=Myoviridae sp. ctQV19 TaxID=2827607 RepID=A0A8S5RSZ2_9CAUD|nr:MAG: hypothetical protein D8B49_06290 [Riemerella sp.]DAE92474.1 MAG TPA: AAA domain protein [Myoviridae sp. ctQV19]DAN53474.1 MAG TPA: AAA domain protein [Caudoviricetes sp.]DAY34482.1 MAG TPA: AAA domain protein [Caudoviricetes sp.]
MILNEYQKTTEIPEALRRYMEETGHTQADISRVSGVGASYLNHIAQGKMIVSNKNGGSEIKDKYYLMLCEAIQYPLKQEVWRHFNTYNFKQSINRIKSARTEKLRFTIDGDTGAGKTHACREYQKKYPKETYIVTCSAIENSKEFAKNIAEAVDVSTIGTAGTIIKEVIKKLTKQCDNALLIIDEAEHIEKKSGYINIIKALADGLENKVAFGLVGMDINKILQNGYERNKQNFRQTARRFNLREKFDNDITEDIENICEDLGITSKNAQNWLKNRIKNFGDLEIIIKEAFKEAEKTNEPITDKLLKTLEL